MDRKILNKVSKIIRVENEKQYILFEDLETFGFNSYEYLYLFEVLDRNNIDIKGIYKNGKAEKINNTILEYQKDKSDILRDKIFDMCKSYIYQICHTYSKRYNIPSEELFSYAYEGFILAITKYKNAYKLSFRDYCIKRIQEYLLNSIRYINTAGIACSLYYNFMKAKYNVEKNSSIKLEEDITILDDILKELQNDYNYSEETINHIRGDYLLNSSIPLESIENSYLYDEQEDKIINKVVVNDALESLKEKKKNIIKLRYGFFGNQEYLCREIGEIYNMTRKGASIAINTVINDDRIKRKLRDL